MSQQTESARAELEQLCPDCLELAASRYLARFGPPRERCEECERLRALGASSGESVPPRDVPADTPARERRGLCADCENRDTCVLSDAPAGVWYCSEYR
jgi:hypothetical protein